MPGGRPMKFKNKEELQKRIEEYFEWAEKNKKPLTIERLAYFLDVDRDTILRYSKTDEFYGTIKRARTYILSDKVERLTGGVGSATGIIFDLKNNEGWKDKNDDEAKRDSENYKIIFND